MNIYADKNKLMMTKIAYSVLEIKPKEFFNQADQYPNK